MRISRREAMTLTAMATLFFTESAVAETTVLRGTVDYRKRIALPPNASVLVQLLDVSPGDAPAKVIAEDHIRSATTSPIPYRLSFDRRQIDLDHSYALTARIFTATGSCSSIRPITRSSPAAGTARVSWCAKLMPRPHNPGRQSANGWPRIFLAAAWWIGFRRSSKSHQTVSSPELPDAIVFAARPSLMVSASALLS